MRKKHLSSTLILLILVIINGCNSSNEEGLVVTDSGYFEMPGLNVLVFNNSYSEGHQGGIEIIQHGNRVATNGNLRLDASPGKWQPVPMLGEGFQKVGCSPQQIGLLSRKVDNEKNEISLNCSYPDPGRKEKGFNPIVYPDLEIKYNVTVQASGNTIIISVDLEEPLPEEWVGEVGYNMELFPGDLYGKTYAMDKKTGIFPRQANGPVYQNRNNESEVVPIAEGTELVVAPESELQRISFKSTNGNLMLLDGSLKHNNGWFVIRSLVPANTTKGAIRWLITPNTIPNWIADPIVHVSQVGYHPEQKKMAFVELDKNDENIKEITLQRIEADGQKTTLKKQAPEAWGRYLRYQYLTFDFSEVKGSGMYCIAYGNSFTSNYFQIDPEVYERDVWQPTLEYFIPVQMCHMRINQKYRVWHGACHLDDALMAPLNIAHFDGYNNTQESSTLSPYKPLEHVPGLNVGGWHDAADYDLRIESQAQTVLTLALTYEEFGIDYDVTFIDQENRHVEIHHPDGKADILQQVEHGVLTILGGYHHLGRLYRGIIVPSLRQYVHLGDGATQTDNLVFDHAGQRMEAAKINGLWYKKVANRYSNTFDPEMYLDKVEVYSPTLDDRLVFTETNPARQLHGAAALAAASRVLKAYDLKLSEACIMVAEEIYEANKDFAGSDVNALKIQTLSELILATDKERYKNDLIDLGPNLAEGFERVGWSVGRVLPLLESPEFSCIAKKAAMAYKPNLDSLVHSTPFGVPLENTEVIGFKQYFYNKAWPDIFNLDNLFNSVNYNLGCRPGNTVNTLVSGVGAESPTVAYGSNRADWSYIPGGTFWNAVNLVSPDYAEDKIWPYFWQEREYIITAPCYYMFSVLAAKESLTGN